MSKQNLWFLTLASLILVLGIYYVTMPNDVLKEMKSMTEEKIVLEEIKEENILTAMRVNLEEERKEKLEVLKEQLVSEELTGNEQNNLYEQLKYLNEIQGKEEKIEKKIKQEQNVDCFIKIEATNISAVCVSNEHDSTMANRIMRIIQNEYKEKKNITVKFQKK
ncbi:MAG: SpoIIIAH-like family protein [Bacilli bacterium]|nr:SpoIIIAH-like family protein [Bacilli bacterium]